MKLSLQIAKGFETTEKVKNLLPDELKSIYNGFVSQKYSVVSVSDKREYFEFNFNIAYVGEYKKILKLFRKHFDIISVSVNGNESNTKEFSQWINRLIKGEKIYVEKTEKVIDKTKYLIDSKNNKWFLYNVNEIVEKDIKYELITVIHEKLLINGRLPIDNNKLTMSLMEEFSKSGIRKNNEVEFDDLEVKEFHMFDKDVTNEMDAQQKLFEVK